MALHGDIRVNSQIIGYWEAVRQGPIRDENTYAVLYWYTSPDQVTFSNTGEVLHAYANGAPLLVSRIMEFIAYDVRRQRAEH